MPDIDPAALGRSDSLANGSATPSISTKPLPGAGAASAQKAGKPPPAAPRVDLEQIYTSLKTAIGEHWATYKDAISRFVLGHLSQAELTRLTEHFISIDANREHLHNQLICGVYANALRDVPEQPVAVWVSANDKPTAVPKPLTGDAAEQRLKVEVMQLPSRIRQRLKGVQDEPYSRAQHELLLHAAAKRILSTSANTTNSLTTPSTSTSAAGLNTELEIRKRYTLPLSTESHDLPASTILTDRIVPMCYEEGLPAGLGNAGPCIDLLATGLDTFVKEVVSDILGRCRTNAPVSGPDLSSANTTAPTQSTTVAAPAAPQVLVSSASTVGLGAARTASGVMTSRYKQRLQAEEAAFGRGEVKRSETGLLPVEIAALKLESGGVLGTAGDVRLAWETSEPWLAAMMPWLGERVVLGEYPYGHYDTAIDEDVTMTDIDDHQVNGFLGPLGAGAKTSKNAAPKVNGVPMVNGDHDDLPTTAGDEADSGWQGASCNDRTALTSLLDDCLSFGL